MAPIPVRLPEETHSLISAAERRYRYLHDVEIPKLRNCTGPLAIQQTFAEELREDTVLLVRQIEVYHHSTYHCLPLNSKGFRNDGR